LICKIVLYGFGAQAGSGGKCSTGHTGDNTTRPLTGLWLITCLVAGAALAQTPLCRKLSAMRSTTLLPNLFTIEVWHSHLKIE
jgi:hypothetical protein